MERSTVLQHVNMCSITYIYSRFEGVYYLHLQGNVQEMHSRNVSLYTQDFFLLWQSSMCTNKPFDSNLICYEKYKVLIL
jgi:hypothetical protein